MEGTYPQLIDYLLNQFTFFWMVILGVFGIISVALYFLVKSLVESGINKGEKAISEKLERLDEKIIRTQDSLDDATKTYDEKIAEHDVLFDEIEERQKLYPHDGESGKWEPKISSIYTITGQLEFEVESYGRYQVHHDLLFLTGNVIVKKLPEDISKSSFYQLDIEGLPFAYYLPKKLDGGFQQLSGQLIDGSTSEQVPLEIRVGHSFLTFSLLNGSKFDEMNLQTYNTITFDGYYQIQA